MDFDTIKWGGKKQKLFVTSGIYLLVGFCLFHICFIPILGEHQGYFFNPIFFMVLVGLSNIYLLGMIFSIIGLSLSPKGNYWVRSLVAIILLAILGLWFFFWYYMIFEFFDLIEWYIL